MLDFTIRALDVFFAVAKDLSFSQAADHLFMSQSSVSKIIMRLENNLGTQLFSRTSHGVELTSSGEFLFEELGIILPQIHQVFSDLSSINSPIKEHLSLSMPSSTCRRLVNDFVTAYPSIRFSSSQNYDPFIAFNDLFKNDPALWITHSLLIPEDYMKHITIHRIYEDPVYVILPLDHPFANAKFLSIQDLQRENLICHSNHTLAMAKALSINAGLTLRTVDMRDSINTRAMCLIAICAGKGISLFYKSDFEMIATDKIVRVPLQEGECCAVVACLPKSRKLEIHEETLLHYLSKYWDSY